MAKDDVWQGSLQGGTRKISEMHSGTNKNRRIKHLFFVLSF